MRSLWSSLILASTLVGVTVSAANTCVLSDAVKSDCAADGLVSNADECLARGCCWQRSFTNENVPWCYHSAASSPTVGYDLQSMTTTETGLAAKLTLRDSQSANTVYGPGLSQLSLAINYLSEDILQVKLTDATQSRWEVPESILPRPPLNRNAHSLSKLYTVSYTSSPFSLTVRRISDQSIIFDLDSELIFKDQYLEMNVNVEPIAKTFGLGESTRLEQVLQVPSMHTLWAADIAAQQFYTNLYGSYPYYLQLVNGQTHGVMLLNSNGMDVSVLTDSVRFQVIGGVMDFYLFVGPTSEDVVRQYTQVVGKPAMQPYWALGLHNCRWGYESLAEIEQVVANYSAAQIPLETQWADIDYMQDYRDFTTDATAFPLKDFRAFVDDLHAKGQRFVPIIDPGIAPVEGYDAFDEGVKQDVFIRDLTGEYFLGQVWPGPTNFPDFLNPKSHGYWAQQVRNFHAKLPIDGLWIDMNEVSNFCNGQGIAQTCALPDSDDDSDCVDGCCIRCKQVDAKNALDYPPYNINNDYGILGIKTLSMAATQYENITYYNAHNLYGISEQIATRKALLQVMPEKRPFVLSRSSFLSTGVHSAKWTGDNGATWDDLRSSIVSMFDFNLFGVPTIGADICGFNGDTTEELCARWIEVGAFYPFSRDHNAIGALSQELYRWPSVAESARKALSIRYQLLPVLYTLLYTAHTQGNTVVRALWNNFPMDFNAVSINRQFMWGDALLFSPVVEANATWVDAYFPASVWYSFDRLPLTQWRDVVDARYGGMTRSLTTTLTETNVHIRGGSILPMQSAAMTTAAARQTPFRLLACLSQDRTASGTLFWDDGEQNTLAHSLFVQYDAQVLASGSRGALIGKVVQQNLHAKDILPLERIEIVGVDWDTRVFKTVFVNDQSVPFVADGQSIVVTNLPLTIVDSFVLRWE